jgi:uncharacterized coiled-coil protein SlyX
MVPQSNITAITHAILDKLQEIEDNLLRLEAYCEKFQNSEGTFYPGFGYSLHAPSLLYEIRLALTDLENNEHIEEQNRIIAEQTIMMDEIQKRVVKDQYSSTLLNTKSIKNTRYRLLKNNNSKNNNI